MINTPPIPKSSGASIPHKPVMQCVLHIPPIYTKLLNLPPISANFIHSIYFRQFTFFAQFMFFVSPILTMMHFMHRALHVLDAPVSHLRHLPSPLKTFCVTDMG